MAGGQQVIFNGYRFVAKPLSLYRCILGDFFPYWQASKPRFVLVVTREGPPAQKQTINWYVKFANNDVTGEQENIPPLQTAESVTLKLEGKLLGFTGDTVLILSTDLTSHSPSRYKTLYTFHTTPKVWLFLAFVAGLLAGAFAAVFQWLFCSLSF
jgi:hypothetical protein